MRIKQKFQGYQSFVSDSYVFAFLLFSALLDVQHFVSKGIPGT
jgi:hypothetical protein